MDLIGGLQGLEKNIRCRGNEYYEVEPEVAGGFGPGSVIDRSGARIEVTRLHYEFDGWLGDELNESTPCFLVSTRLRREIDRQKMAGVTFADVEVTLSDEFRELHPGLRLPEFMWLKIHGSPGQDDFGISPSLMLIVSDDALLLLKNNGVSHAIITPLDRATSP